MQVVHGKVCLAGCKEAAEEAILQRASSNFMYGARMTLTWIVLRVILVAVIVVAVGELSKRFPRAGALLLSLPIVSILAFHVAWFQHRDLPAISRLARETLILVPLSLPFFVPLAFADRMGLSFWTALITGVLLAALTTSVWLFLGPNS